MFSNKIPISLRGVECTPMAKMLSTEVCSVRPTPVPVPMIFFDDGWVLVLKRISRLASFIKQVGQLC